MWPLGSMVGVRVTIKATGHIRLTRLAGKRPTSPRQRIVTRLCRGTARSLGTFATHRASPRGGSGVLLGAFRGESGLDLSDSLKRFPKC